MFIDKQPFPIEFHHPPPEASWKIQKYKRWFWRNEKSRKNEKCTFASISSADLNLCQEDAFNVTNKSNLYDL
jgi:hypothetical protein